MWKALGKKLDFTSDWKHTTSDVIIAAINFWRWWSSGKTKKMIWWKCKHYRISAMYSTGEKQNLVMDAVWCFAYIGITLPNNGGYRITVWRLLVFNFGGSAIKGWFHFGRSAFTFEQSQYIFLMSDFIIDNAIWKRGCFLGASGCL